MGWWKLPGSSHEVMGDEAAEAAAELLAPVSALQRRPTLDELLDALEVALRAEPRADGPADPQIVVGDRPRRRSAALPALVDSLLPGLQGLHETYQDNFKRVATTRECLEAISFVLCSDPQAYLRELDATRLDHDLTLVLPN